MKKTIIISIAVIAASGILAFSGYASADNTKEVAANTTSTVELIDRTADQKAMEPQKEEPVAKDVHETYNYSYNDYGRCYDSKPAKKTASTTDSNAANNYEYKTEYNYTDNSNYIYSSEYSEYNDYDNNYEDYHYDDEDCSTDESSTYEGADESYDYEGANESYDYDGTDEEGADESFAGDSEDYDYDENADYDTDYDADEIEENTWECVEDVDEAVYEMCCSEDNIFTGVN